MPRSFSAFFAAAGLQLIAVVLAHEIVYLARYGSRYGEALVHAGHGQSWTAAVMSSLALAGVLAAIGAIRLVYLGLLVRRARPMAATAGALESRSLLRAWFRIAPRTAVLSIALLSVQENVERATIGQAMPGAGVLLSPEYPAGLWITIAVGFAVAFVAALFAWRHSVLLARLRASRAPVPPRVRTGLRPGSLVRPPASSIQGRRSALRAPPSAAAA